MIFLKPEKIKIYKVKPFKSNNYLGDDTRRQNQSR